MTFFLSSWTDHIRFLFSLF